MILVTTRILVTRYSQRVKPIKTAADGEADLETEYLAKLKIDNRNIQDSFKIPHEWMNEDEGMRFLS